MICQLSPFLLTVTKRDTDLTFVYIFQFIYDTRTVESLFLPVMSPLRFVRQVIWQASYRFSPQHWPVGVCKGGTVWFLWSEKWVHVHHFDGTVAQWAVKVKKKSKVSRNRPWRPIGLWDVKDPTLSRQSAHS
jgi:hypothetical protein